MLWLARCTGHSRAPSSAACQSLWCMERHEAPPLFKHDQESNPNSTRSRSCKTQFQSNEHNACIDNALSHLYGMRILQLRMSRVTEEKLQQLNMDYPLNEHSRELYKVRLGFEESFDDDDVDDEEKA
ncbi:hypothetical protein HAX54_047120 [Datura stramonium]|uniref:Uncharacterized protein n=1 Tax=Datura stramonium TaxID=4076 RepID=A0ABS8WJZ1_DATST|nr:hypothetical protein [Datura stramonium]